MKYITILLTLTIFTFGINSVRSGELSEELQGDGTESVYQKLRKNYEIESVKVVSLWSLYHLQQVMGHMRMSWVGKCFFEDTPQGTDLITLRFDPFDQIFVSLATSQENTDNPNYDLSSPKTFYDMIKAKRYLIFQLDGVNKIDSVYDLSSPKMFYDMIKAKRYLIFQLDGVNKIDSVEARLRKILLSTGESEPISQPQQTVPSLCHFWEKWDIFD